jgi:hypothetical protein
VVGRDFWGFGKYFGIGVDGDGYFLIGVSYLKLTFL